MPPRRPRFVDTPARAPSWHALHQVADAQYPALARLWAFVFADLKEVLTQNAVAEALLRGDLPALQVILARAWPQVSRGSARASFLTLLRETVTQATRAVAPALRETLDVAVRVRFNVVSQEALVWIARYAGTQIREIGQATMEAVRAIVQRQFTAGTGLTDVMAQLERTVGLTIRQITAVETLQAQLREAEVPSGAIARQVEAAAARALRQRVEQIARTESLQAANAAQQLSWEAAEARGFLDPARFHRFWILTPDSRLCPICKQIPGRNRRGVGLHEPFDTPIGAVHSPPVHIQCRCAVSLREV